MISLQRFAGMNCHYIRHSRDHFFASMEALGYERIELWAASPHYFAPHFSEAMVRALKADMARHGLSLVCLTPEQVTYPVNIASGEAYLRELSIDLHKKTLEHAALLESPLMLLTPGYGNLDEPRRGMEALRGLLRTARAVCGEVGRNHRAGTPFADQLQSH
jgi:protein FrlC